MLRFLYYEDINAENPEVVDMRLCRVPFGITPSQWLMITTIRKHGKKYKEIDPEFTKVTEKDFYSDDLSSGADSVSKGLTIYKKVKIRFAEVHFNLRKWRTNSDELRKMIPEEDLMKEDNENVLGTKWNHSSDTLHMSVCELFEEAEKVEPTLRNILKIKAKIFDPLGLLAHITTSLNLLFQDIWVKGAGWDDQIDESLEKKWVSIVKMLKSSTELIIKRCYFVDDINDPIVRLYLHGFSDASERAYAGCIYIQAVSASGKVQVSLVTSKSRVKPARKEITIPRMELLGNLILAKLMKVVYETLSEERNIDDYFCWTDAKVTLAWIRAVNRKFTVFVQNHLNKIRRLLPVKKWDYVATKENPADLVTRSFTGKLSEIESWIEGPEMLKKEKILIEEYSNTVEITDDIPLDEEMINVHCVRLSEDELHEYNNELIDNKVADSDVDNCIGVMVTATENVITASPKQVITGKKIDDFICDNIGHLINIEKFSSLDKLLNVTAWCGRILQSLGVRDGELTVGDYITAPERDKALKLWIRANQKALKLNPKYKEICCSLNLQEDENGILRAPGRIQRSPLPENRKNPVMLERSHRLAELILWDCHDRVWHNGPKETRTEFQSEYWVTNCYSFTSRILYRCVLCRWLNSRAYNYPKSPELPELRFNDVNAFKVTGVDHIGPLYCKSSFKETSPDEDGVYECHAALYTCASTRGIVLDLVPSTSSKDFIDSFQRFIARRGCPQQMLSDPGSGFTATKTQMFATERNISWKFTLTKAPWHGAIWERLVQSVKRCLKKVVGRTTLTFVELQTVLLRIEAILNSRPLCQLEDGDMIEPLTPNHLLFGRKLSQVNTEPATDDGAIDSNRSKKKVQYIDTLVSHYWERWRKEYVTSLRDWKSYKRSNAVIPEVDDVVLIWEEKIPRQNWLLGRIIELLRSRDGQTRGAKVVVGKTRAIIERPINKLYPIEFAVEREIQSKNESYSNTVEFVTHENEEEITERPRRKAAIAAETKLQNMT